MKKNLYSLSVVAVTMLALSGSALAEGTNLDVNFTANIRETTCDMKLMGGTGSDTDQTLLIGNGGQVRLDDVKAGTANANFKIVIVECPASLTSLKATVKGDFSAVEIARASAPEAPFIINSDDDAKRLVWSATEIQNKEVPLVATIRETKVNSMTVGDFEATATFEFSYE